MTLVTTHHSRLKAYAAETPEAVNAAMEFDEATLEPTYRLLAGLHRYRRPSACAGHVQAFVELRTGRRRHD